MEPANRLPLVQQAMRLLVDKLGENDRVAIVVYSAASGLALPSTRGDRKEQIRSAIENLKAGGSTNGAQGIELACQTAAEHSIKVASASCRSGSSAPVHGRPGKRGQDDRQCTLEACATV